MEGVFSRQQILNLTSLSAGQLSRLDKSGVVVPAKLGNPDHPTVLYTLEQLRELRIIAALREKLSMQEVKKVLKYLKQHGFDKSLLGKFLVFCNDKLYWVQSDELGQRIIELSKKNRGQIVLKAVHPIGDVLSDLQQESEQRKSSSSRRTRKATTAVG